MKAALIFVICLMFLSQTYSSFLLRKLATSPKTCCNLCSQSLILPGPQSPSKLKSIITLAISRQWTLSNFVTRLQGLPAIYFTELYDSITMMNTLVQSGSSSCGGKLPLSYPNEYLPPQFINSLYDTMINAYNNNSSKLDPSYAQGMVDLLTSLQTQFNNNFGVPVDDTANNTFISYRDDPADITTGVVSSIALASTFASSLLNSVDPILLAQIYSTYSEIIGNYLDQKKVYVLPEDIDISTQMGKNKEFLGLDFNNFRKIRPRPSSLRTFTTYVSLLNGSPFGLGVNNRLGQTSINGFRGRRLQKTKLNQQQVIEQGVSKSDFVNAKLAASLFAGFAYCFYPNLLIGAMQGTCMGSCDRSC